MFNWKWASDILKWEKRMRQLGFEEDRTCIEAVVTLSSGEIMTVMEVTPKITGPFYSADPIPERIRTNRFGQ